MRLSLRLLWLAAAACACAAHAAAAEPVVPSPAVVPSRQLIEQKAAFLKRVLSDSPAIKRISGSRNEEAMKYFAEAQRNYRDALQSIRTNDISGADKQLNEATRLIGKARQLAPDPLVRDAAPQVRYAQVLASVESLRVTYSRHLQVSNPSPAGPAVADALLARVGQLVDRAKELARSEQLAQANRALGEAERALMTGLGRILGSKTIEYSLRFQSATDEFAYELERNHSFRELVPIALEGFKPAAVAVREAEQLIEGNRLLREQAQQLAAAGDHRAALAALRKGTAQLQEALAVTGLRVPQE